MDDIDSRVNRIRDAIRETIEAPLTDEGKRDLAERHLVSEYLRSLADKVEFGSTKAFTLNWKLREELRSDETIVLQEPVRYISIQFVLGEKDGEVRQR